MSIVLSALMKNPIKFIQIRAARKNAGLASQQLKDMLLYRNLIGERNV